MKGSEKSRQSLLDDDVSDGLKKAYTRFLKNRLYASTGRDYGELYSREKKYRNQKSNESCGDKSLKRPPQETVEKMLENLKLQQETLKNALEECLQRAEQSEDCIGQQEIIEYRVEQLFIQISDKITELEDTLLFGMDRVGENIFNNLIKANEGIEESCCKIQNDMDTLCSDIERLNEEQLEKVAGYNRKLSDEVKEYIDERLKNIATQSMVEEVNRKFFLIYVLGGISVIGIIANLILLFAK